jgi:hypothetical protein
MPEQPKQNFSPLTPKEFIARTLIMAGVSAFVLSFFTPVDISHALLIVSLCLNTSAIVGLFVIPSR